MIVGTIRSSDAPAICAGDRPVSKTATNTTTNGMNSPIVPIGAAVVGSEVSVVLGTSRLCCIGRAR